ncbi:hypothetical protein H6503_06410 [Candidatus Woesearchaeota archaeon]|nr:hypothetical protein [Candidatus Woesearchaeota archaeon]
MFDFLTDKIPCPSCGQKIAPSKIQVSRHRNIKVYNCGGCNADFVKNKRSELFRVLEEGVILC